MASAPGQGTARGLHSLALDALSLAFVLVVLFLRARDAFEHPQFWAEDGAVFFQEAWTDGPASLAYSYAGYLHVIPRAVALAVEPFGALAAPGLYVAASVIFTLWSSWTIARTTLPHARLLSITVALVPGCGDVLGTLTNVQWILQPALLALVISDAPDSARVRANQCAFAAMSGLSGPFSILLLPLALWNLVHRTRPARNAEVCIIVALAAIVQFAMVATHSSNVEPGTFRPWHLFHTLLRLSVYPTTAGASLYILIGLTAAMAAISCPRLVAQSLLYILLALSSTFVRYIGNGDYMDQGWGERYFYMPRLFLMWCIVIGIFHPWRGAAAIGAPTWTRVVASAIAAAALVLVVARGAEWRRAPMPVLPWRSQAWKIDRGEAAAIVINPSEALTPSGEAWHVDIPAMP